MVWNPPKDGQKFVDFSLCFGDVFTIDYLDGFVCI